MQRPMEQFGRVLMPEKKKNKAKHKTKIMHKISAAKIAFNIKKTRDLSSLVFSCIFAYLCGGIEVVGTFNPVGIGCVASYFGKGAKFYFVCMAAFLGYASNSDAYGMPIYIVGVCIAAVLDFFLESRNIKSSVYINGAKGGMCILASGACFLFINGISTFIVLRLLVEALAVFTISILINNGTGVFESGIKNHVLSDDMFISAAAVIIIALSALAGKGGFGFSLAMFFGTYIMLVSGFSAGAAVGCATGVVFAFCLVVISKGSASLFMVLTIASFLCGAFNKGRVHAVTAFLLGGIIPAFYLSIPVSKAVVIAIGVASVVFLLTPKHVFENLNTFASHEKEFDCEEYFIRIKELTNKKLKAFAGAFGALAQVFDTGEPLREITPKGAGVIIDKVSQKVCESCSMSLYCWRTKSFEVYGAIQQIIGDIENKGEVDKKKLQPWLKNSCVRLDRLVEETIAYTNEYKNNMAWENKFNESKSILKEQLNSVEKIVGELGTQVIQMPRFNESLGKEIRHAMLKKNMDVKKVYAVKEGGNGTLIYITKKCCFGNNQCKNTILPIVNRITGRHFILEHDNCVVDKNDNCTVVLKENKGLVFETAIAKEVKYGSSRTGDTAFSDEYEAKKVVMALCDGMGSGESAAKESLRAIDLTKKFVKAGFDLSLTLKVLNSALATGSGEMYTTLDICSINLYTGECEIIKNGGATIFIYSDGKTTAIRSSSLPVGVIRDWQGERTVTKLKSRDVVVMVTDGITDSFGIDNEEKYVTEILLKSAGNVDKIASTIVEIAKKCTKGIAEDDMSVVVGRII